MRDVLRLTLGHLDDEDLAKACVLNKEFSNKICNNNFWINKIYNRFDLLKDQMDLYKGENTYWAYYNYLSDFEKNPTTDFDLTRTDLLDIALKILPTNQILILIERAITSNLPNSVLDKLFLQYSSNIKKTKNEATMDILSVFSLQNSLRQRDEKIKFAYFLYDYLLPRIYEMYKEETHFWNVVKNKLLELGLEDLIERRKAELERLANGEEVKGQVYQYFNN